MTTTQNNTIPIDEVITEVYRVKEEISREHNHDIDLILESLRKQESDLREQIESPNTVGDLFTSHKSDLGAA